MAKLEELVENEEFVKKVEASQSEDEVKAVYDEYGASYDKEAEISMEDLKDVSGGFVISAGMAALIIAAAPYAWKAGKYAGVIIRAAYDAKVYGDPYRSYSKSDVDKAMSAIGAI